VPGLGVQRLFSVRHTRFSAFEQLDKRMVENLDGIVCVCVCVCVCLSRCGLSITNY